MLVHALRIAGSTHASDRATQGLERRIRNKLPLIFRATAKIPVEFDDRRASGDYSRDLSIRSSPR